MTPRPNIGTLTILSLPPRRKTFLFLLCFAPLAAANGHAEESPSAKVALVSFDDALAEAVAVTLSAWNVSFERLDASSLTSVMPGTADAARTVARQTGCDAVVWISESDSGPAIWMYDADADKVGAQRLPSSPPFDEPTAASVALSVKTLLRHSRFAPQKTPPPTETNDPKTIVTGAPPPESRAQIVLGAGLEGRLRRRAPDELRLHLAVEFFAWPRLHLGAALDLGLGGRVDDVAVAGELTTYQATLEAGTTAFQRGRLALYGAAGAGLTTSRLRVNLPEERSVNRFNPSLEARAQLAIGITAGISIGVDVGASALLRRQRYVIDGREVFVMPRFEGGATVTIRLKR